MPRRSRPSPAFVLAAIALFVALGGSAVALTGHNTVFTDDITNGEVKNRDIADNAVTALKIKDAEVGTAELGNGSVVPDKLGVIPAVRSQSPSESFNNDQILEPDPASNPVQYDEDLYDTANMHTGGTYNAEQSKFNAPRAGVYAISAGLIFSAPGGCSGFGTERQLYLVKNGATYLASSQVPPRTTGATIMNVSAEAQLAQGDYVQAVATHDACENLVTPLSQFGTYGDGRHFFSMTWLGPAS
jgi:hypothetical protein